MVGQFVSLLYQLPDLVVAQITRESVQAAVDAGLPVARIVRFLEHNAHPLLRKQAPVLPETVVDQLMLWASERNRISFAPARLYDNCFDSFDRYSAAVRYARGAGILLWSRRHSSTASLCALAVHEDGHRQMKSFLSTLKQQAP